MATVLDRLQLVDAVVLAYGPEHLDREMVGIDDIIARFGHVSVWRSPHGDIHIGKIGPPGWSCIGTYFG